jgi:hypothetical protein
MILDPPSDLAGSLPASARPFLPSVSLALMPGDRMLAKGSAHYLQTGASALAIILTALDVAGAAPPRTILDFGAGAGRVTRWLRAAFPAALIEACDMHQGELDFLAAAFGAETWLSSADVDAIHPPRRYDLIWLGSVLTHLPEATTRALLDKLRQCTNEAGLIVASLHGREAVDRQLSGRHTYIAAEKWPAIEAGWAATGYGFADHPKCPGYGISMSKPSWAAALVEALPDCRVVMLSERAWVDHHDVLAFQRRV